MPGGAGRTGAICLDLGVGLGAAAVVLHDQRPRGGRLEARQRLGTTSTSVDVAAEGFGVDLRELAGDGSSPRSASGAGRSSGSALVRNQPTSTRGSPTVQISQSMTAVTSRADRQEVAEPEVAVHDRRSGIGAGSRARRTRRPRRRHPGASAGSTVSRSRHHRSISAAGPTIGSSARPIVAGVEVVERGERPRRVAHPLAHDGLGIRRRRTSNSGSSDAPSTNAHDEQRRDLGRIAGVFPEHLGNRHRRCRAAREGAAPGAARRD